MNNEGRIAQIPVRSKNRLSGPGAATRWRQRHTRVARCRRRAPLNGHLKRSKDFYLEDKPFKYS